MPAIIYEKTPDGLTATGDRNVSTFPSGLCRVDQTFVCKSSMAATHRLALSVGSNFPNGNYPAIDGLKIYPEVQETKKSDGFTEFNVSAYGRTLNSLDYTTKIIKKIIPVWAYKMVDGIIVEDTINARNGRYFAIEVMMTQLDCKFAIKKGQDLSIEELNLPSDVFNIKSILNLNPIQGYELSPLTALETKQYEYVDWNGTKRFNKFTIYQYEYFNDFGDSFMSRISYDQPAIYLNNIANFGSFSEIDISILGRVSELSFTSLNI